MTTRVTFVMQRAISTVSSITLLLLVLSMGVLTGCQDSSTTDSSTSQDSSTTDSSTSQGSSTTDISTFKDGYDKSDYTWDTSAVSYITLNGDSISEDSDGATATGSVLTIISSGTYDIRGKLTNGRIIVNTDDTETGVVRLIFSGVDITCLYCAPFYVAHAARSAVILPDDTINVLTDAASYTDFDNPEDSEPNAAFYSKDYLTIGVPDGSAGTGQLTVTGNYNDGITGKDGVVIQGGKITANAVDDGIRGKDYLLVMDGAITVSTTTGDGFTSDNAEDTDKGYVCIKGGKVDIRSEGDAIQAETYVLIYGGTIYVESGGGAGTAYDTQNESKKGFKGTVGVLIKNGNFVLNTADDAIHSNNSVEIDGGVFDISSGDDGIHADTKLDVYGGTITINDSYEGIESKVITIHDGNLHIESSDDGVNCSDGSGGSTLVGPGNMATQSTSNDCYLHIYGGYLAVYAQGDGLDSNGNIDMTGGTVLVHGPTANDNGALDCGDFGGTIIVNGGFLVAAGSAGMAVGPNSTSTQQYKLLTFTQKTAATLCHIQSTDGTEIVTFKPSKQYASIVVSSPNFVKGKTYNVYFGGAYSGGTVTDGICQGGTYSGGTQETRLTFTL